MKKVFTKKTLQPYLWASVAFFSLSSLHGASTYPDHILEVVLNNIWYLAYATVINFTLFEYAVPFVLRKRKTVFYNILLGIFFLWFYMMLCACGMYVWRLLGIGLHIYVPLSQAKTVSKLLQSQMEYSMGSVFFFGI